MKNIKWGKLAKYGAPLALAGGLIATVGLTADASPISANVTPTITGANVVNGSLGEADLYAPFVASMRTVFNNGVDSSVKIKDGVIAEADLNPALKAKVNAVGSGAQGPAGPAGPAGPTGPQGPAGNNALVSVSAMSSLTNRPDSGLHGTWATDTLTRNISITRQHATKASDCGPTATTCWFYTGSIADNGTFATVAGADSPEAGTPITGTVTGTVSGASKIEFYASSDAPNPALVDATVNGSAHPTAQWAAMFFPAGTKVTDSDLIDWGWNYFDPELCNQWVNAKAGNTGDITGTNGC